MLDIQLSQSFLKDKLKLLFTVFGIALLIGIINLVLFGGTFEGEKGITLFSGISGASFMIGFIGFLFIQAYQDYYTGFPIAIFAGKTRGQFLLSSLLTSLLCVFLGTIILAIWLRYFSLRALDPSVEVNIAFLPKVELISGFKGMITMALFFSYQAVLIHLIALLNYRFGAKVWFYISAFVISLALIQLLPFYKSIAPYVDFLSLQSWLNVFGGETLNYVMDFLRLILILGVISIITLKLPPIPKK